VDVVEALAGAADMRARLGLMAFSHRRPADCEDAEPRRGSSASPRSPACTWGGDRRWP
jgi:hypothetical protein